ncbi:hypothetical protein LCGC14_1655380 [marine sediment metagenome]|uniref:Uncharacterized protein n=1 Tax=marine sediment metagenome TaxID=412755 RepID=A0A0F9KBF0_9ZZZZ
MINEYLDADDSFILTHPDTDKTKAYLFGRRLGRQVSTEMDTTFGHILEHLGVSMDFRDGDLLEAHAERLQALEEQMGDLIVDICRRKAR